MVSCSAACGFAASPAKPQAAKKSIELKLRLRQDQVTQGADTAIRCVLRRPVDWHFYLVRAALILQQFLARLRRDIALQEQVEEEIHLLLIALLAVLASQDCRIAAAAKTNVLR